jgi:NDP-sugar pyrophosphorylase family protein
VLTAVLEDATGYGRVVRGGTDGEGNGSGPHGDVRAIVEQRDADAATAAIREINTGVYVFRAGQLESALARLTRDNAQGEEYLTDVVALLVGDGHRVAALSVADPAEASGVNDRVQLSAAGRALRDRVVEAAMRAGTTIIDPATTWIDADVTLEPDTTIAPHTSLHGRTHLARGATVGPECTLTDTVVGPGATVIRTTAERAEIGAGAAVGPYTHLRPGTRLGRAGKIGSFVETKSAQLGDETKVPHLAYVGDAVVGDRSNIGCTTVFANYRLGRPHRQRHDPRRPRHRRRRRLHRGRRRHPRGRPPGRPRRARRSPAHHRGLGGPPPARQPRPPGRHGFRSRHGSSHRRRGCPHPHLHGRLCPTPAGTCGHRGRWARGSGYRGLRRCNHHVEPGNRDRPGHDASPDTVVHGRTATHRSGRVPSCGFARHGR